jgi:hypothetical protein
MGRNSRKGSENIIEAHEKIYGQRTASEMRDAIGSTKHINMGYLSFLIFGVALGNI